MTKFELSTKYVGEFGPNDGGIDFYLRVNSLLQESFTVLDLGAGRGAWFDDDKCEIRRSLRLIRGKVHEVIGADVDDAVTRNNSVDRCIVFGEGGIREKLPENSIDLIIADYVLEHIADRNAFFKDINHCLRPGGWFCARTPHKYSYVALLASLVKNKFHKKVLEFIQPDRKSIDVFPTTYELNTLTDVRKTFESWENRSFLFQPNPAYFFGSKVVYSLMSLFHKIFPSVVSANLFVFVKKPG